MIMKKYYLYLLMTMNRNELLMVLKYYSYLNDNFIFDLEKYDTDELRKLIKYYNYNIDEELDENILQNAMRFYDEKQGMIDNEKMVKKMRGFLCD
jgi:Ca2+-binding EF-hand superfamily protein